MTPADERSPAPAQGGYAAAGVDIGAGEAAVELMREHVARTARPEAFVPLPRRETRECLAEDLRRLDPDAIYFSALEGIDQVEYV